MRTHEDPLANTSARAAFQRLEGAIGRARKRSGRSRLNRSVPCEALERLVLALV